MYAYKTNIISFIGLDKVIIMFISPRDILSICISLQLFNPKGEDGWEYTTPLRKRIPAAKTTPQHKNGETAENTR